MGDAPNITFRYQPPYHRSWRLMELRMTDRPRGPRQWMILLWGFDIFFGPVPFLKTIVAADVLAAWLVR